VTSNVDEYIAHVRESMHRKRTETNVSACDAVAYECTRFYVFMRCTVDHCLFKQAFPA
jgi:hypothetical protein